MAEIVAGFGVPHTPMAPEQVERDPNGETAQLYAAVREHLAAVQPDVKLNGEVVGTAVPNGFFYVDRPAGKYDILTTTEVDRKLSLTLDKGQTRYVRLGVSIGFFVGHVYPELVEPSVGAKEIQETQYSGGPQN